MTLEELICRARAGDGEAFTALMEGQKQTLYKVARSYLRSDADAADAIGMLLHVPDVDQVERVALEYADGTSYVVCDRAADLDNTEYALSWTRGEGQGLTLVFNRLADPDQVRAVTVDGVRYSVE